MKKEIDIQEVAEIAKKAGKRILEIYATDFESKEKAKNLFLTQADLDADRIICEELAKTGIPILSEESKDDLARIESDLVWIVDPLDGTNDFVGKTGEFVVMIGLAEKGRPLLGVIFWPLKNTTYFAQKGRGAFRADEQKKIQLKVSSKKQTEGSAMLLSNTHLLEADVDLAEKLKVGKRIAMGSAGLKFAKIVEGEAEIYVNTSSKTGEWDTCAGTIILEEAGGKITDLKGERMAYNKKVPKNKEGFVASNGKIHDEIVNITKNINIKQ